MFMGRMMPPPPFSPLPLVEQPRLRYDSHLLMLMLTLRQLAEGRFIDTAITIDGIDPIYAVGIDASPLRFH